MQDRDIQQIRTVADLRGQVAAWRAAGERVALVPTMGALHAGHLSLVKLAREKADRCVASIFVNPKQFAAHEDLSTYPRGEARDLDLLQETKADAAFLPDEGEMYAEGFSTRVEVDGLTDCLCGASRPHFFGGVATVVCKLLLQCGPDVALFGEKDYQQLLVIRRMAADLDIPTKILGAPIVREADGLAMSSRNAYLSPEQRQIAGRLNAIMTDTLRRLAAGNALAPCLAEGREALLKAGFQSVDYYEARAAGDLALAQDPIGDRPARLFCAAHIGPARLIDNMPIP